MLNHHVEYASRKIRRGIGVLKRLQSVIPCDSQKLQVPQKRAASVITLRKYEYTNHAELLKGLN